MKRSGQTAQDYASDDGITQQQSAGDGARNAARHAVPESSGLANEAEQFFEQARRAAETGAAALNRTVKQNPTLALAGLVAFGAIAAVAIRQRRARPESMARQLQSDMIRHTSSMRKAIRQEIRDSGIGSKFDSIGASMGAIDWKPYIQPFLEKAVAAADEAKAKLASVTK